MSIKNKNIKINTKERVTNLKKENANLNKITLRESTVVESEKKEKERWKEKTITQNMEDKLSSLQKNKNTNANRRNTSNISNINTGQDKRITLSTESKKHYLNDFEKTLKNKDKNCINYAYKNIREVKNYTTNIKKLNENTKALEILTLEKNIKKINKVNIYKDDEKDKNNDSFIHSLIYDAFTNTNLKIPTNILSERSSSKSKKKVTKKESASTKNIMTKEIKTNKKITDDQNQFEVYKKNISKILQNNLIAPEVERTYETNYTQPMLEEIKKEETGYIKRKEKNKTVATQIDFQYEDDLKCASKIIAQRILNEAFIQISYEQHFKQLEEQKESVEKCNEINKNMFKKLVNTQKNNLNIMKEENKINSFLNICVKINLFMISRGIADLLLNENTTLLKMKEEFDIREKIKWQNEIAKHVTKNTMTLLKTKKISSYITEEIIEENIINSHISRDKKKNIIKENLNYRKTYLHEKRKIDKGHLSLRLDIENNTIYVPIQVEKHMTLHDVLRKAKNFIKKEYLFLKKEYNLNFLCIKNKGEIIKNVKELCLAQPGELTICLAKKIKE